MFGGGLQSLFDKARLVVLRTTPEHQVGAIPYMVVDGHVVFLIVTSRRTGRWIFPKGSIMKGMTAPQSAHQEAVEEAGVEGVMSETPIGTYRTIKKRTIAQAVVDVDLYPMRVTNQHDVWPEQFSRHRHWVLLPEARRLLSDPKLGELAAAVARLAQPSLDQDATKPSRR